MKCFSISLTILFIITSIVLAQQAVSVKITKAGSPVVNALVYAENEQTFFHETAITDSLGWAKFSNLPTEIHYNDHSNRNDSYSLISNYPNPFNNSTSIIVQALGETEANVSIYNILGQQVRYLETIRITNGMRRFLWNGKDNHENLMANGIYFAVIKVGKETYFHKMLLLRGGFNPTFYGGHVFLPIQKTAEISAVLGDDSYRFVVSDTAVPPRFALFDTSTISLSGTLHFSVKPLTQSITEIVAFSDSLELVWDWEFYHDLQAIQYNGTNGKCNTFDAPPHFWKDSQGNIFCMAANGVNYRVPFTKNFEPLRSLSSDDIVFNSAKTYTADGSNYFHHGFGSDYLAGSCNEFNYDNNIWIFGVWTADGNNIYALGHHEFYPRTCPVGTTAPWINSVHHLISDDGGASFLPQSYTPYSISEKSNSERLVLVPKPWDEDNPDYINYGFYHPSNIVKEGNYYYAAVEGNFWLGTLNSQEHGLHEGGLVLVRTEQPEISVNWQVYTENGWEVIDHETYQGRGGQDVKLFLRQDSYSPYDQYPNGGQLLSFSLVQHSPSGQWIVLGYSNQGATTVQYSLTKTLKYPEFSAIKTVKNAPVLNLGRYMTLIDHNSPGFVFQYIARRSYLYFIAPNNDSVIPVEMQGSVSDNHSRSIWRVPLIISSE